MKIMIVASGYPTDGNPEFSFVGELAREMVAQGCECSVIAPQSITAQLLSRHEPRETEWLDCSAGGDGVRVIQPKYLSFSSSPITEVLWRRAVHKALDKYASDKTVLYGHFWESGLAICSYAKDRGNTVVVATGESVIPGRSKGDQNVLRNRVDGVIAVSSKNLTESKEKHLLGERCKTILAPNAVNDVFFEKRDKRECREILGLPVDERIALFVGHFDNRKGSKRVDEALTAAGNVKSIFLGSGPEPPLGSHCLYAGKVAHDRLPLYLCACDFFILPTLAEGCCNAIVEAMATCCPIITSRLPFNEDILDDESALLVNPLDIGELVKAICEMRDDENKREQLANAAGVRAEELRLENRARNIIGFIESL